MIGFRNCDLTIDEALARFDRLAKLTDKEKEIREKVKEELKMYPETYGDDDE